MEKETKESQWGTRLLWMVIGAIITFIILYFSKCRADNKLTPITYIPDTVYRQSYIHDTFAGKTIKVPPVIVTEYLDRLQTDTLFQVTVNSDTIFLISPTITDTFYSSFLTNYPNSSKLLYGRFGGDSLTLDLLHKDGTVKKKQYLPDYAHYLYEFVDDDLRAIKIKNTSLGQKAIKNIHNESYLYTTYNPFDKNFKAQLDYSLMYKRFGIYGYGAIMSPPLPISINPRFKGDAGVGIKIKLR